MADENGEDDEFKKQYKRILKDMIRRRNKGFLESEEAIEGIASTSHKPGGSQSSQPNSHGSPSTSDDVGSTLVRSFKRRMKMNSDGVKTTLPSRFGTSDDIREESTAGSDSLLIQNRRSPEGDQPLLIRDRWNTEGTSDPAVARVPLVTPEPSLAQITPGRDESVMLQNNPSRT